MISYKPFWNTLESSQETTYTLITKHSVSSSTINRLRRGDGLSTLTLNDLCRILNCKIEDILEYVPNNDDQSLQ
ncbi:helix-turn-helix domain-containing protein [[Clostridium] fimetarium]|uniref:DNA-binding transcriptional regulator, XRE family n=1 Tax=[Clostridium] fimetarium TaxID=99656 RepID=A0A1I0MXD4_9FIRM|nr:helix-turn-helix domain-containing protein [[Clostridium] fimetarium]SEV93566.1 DNA-binding transcriptional regulator, XRE family [[Clostridium] fimetarium]